MKNISTILCIVFMAVILATAIIYNRSKPRVMVLQSYNPEYAWTRDIDEGLKRVTKNWTGYSVNWHYMDTKKHSDPEWLKRAGIIARRAIKKTRPRVLIAVDDLAQSLAAKYFLNHPEMDIVFAGVNGSVEPYGYNKANNVTGIFEHKQLKAVKEMIIAMENKKKKPKSNPSVVYVLDPSPSLANGKEIIDNYTWYPVIYKPSITARDYPHWQKVIREQSQKVDYIIVANYRKLHTAGPNSAYADPMEVMKWTESASKVPIMGINSFNVEDGGMISIGVSPFEQGEVAAQLAQQIIEQKVRANAIAMVENTLYIVAIREASLKHRDIELPAIYEAFGRATENYIEE